MFDNLLNLNNNALQIKFMPKITPLTRAEIRAKIAASESFWCATSRERQDAITQALAVGADYVTRSDDRGGFYVVKLTLPPRLNGASKK